MTKKKRSSHRRSSSTSAAGTFTSPSSLLSHSLTVSPSSLKSLIHSLAFPSSSPLHSLPSCLHSSILSSVSAFKQNPSSFPPSPPLTSPSNSPPAKRSRLDSLTPVKTYAQLTRLLFSHPNKPFSSDEILPCLRSLHDNLVLFEDDESLLFQISSLCEDWWKEKLDGKELLIAQSLPYLLARSLNLAKKSDVRRVFGLREAFGMFDYEDESIEDVKMLFLRCAIAPVYLKCDEGRKFLSFLFGLNDKLAKEILVLIKSQIPIGKKSVLVAYKEIIFRVWKWAENGEFVRVEIERFLQDLIEGAIYAKTRVLGANIRRVLGGFIEHRTINGVEKLLFQLAEPILFRSLQVANSDVRCNALNLFIDFFPILDPNSTREEKDMLLEKQLFFLEKLLFDSSPEIRSLSIEGLFKIVHLFWEIIPSSTIAKLLTKVFDEMSLDSCNEIRVSCLKGAEYLVQNPLSHEILRVLLVKLGRMVLDPVLSVRVAMIDLLLTVRDIKSLQFNKIVKLDSLLSLLANDQARVAQKITKLLLPTYFPSNLPFKDQYTRFISLIKKHPSAGARFCEFLFSEGSNVKSLTDLIKVSLAFSLSKEKEKALDQEQMDCLIIAISNVINSLVKNSEGDFCDLDPVKGIIMTEKIKILMGLVSTDKAHEAVLNIGVLVFSNNSDNNNSDLIKLRDICMEIILNNSNGDSVSDNFEKQKVLLAAHKLIFALKYSDFLLEKLSGTLESSLSLFHNKKAKHESNSRISKSRISKSRISKPGFGNPVSVAWQVNELVKNEETKDGILESRFSEKIFSCLKALVGIFVEQGVGFEKVDVTIPILAYLNYAMCVSDSSSDELFSTGTEEAFYLTNNMLNLVPIFEKYSGTKNASIFLPIAKDWLPVFLLGLGCTKLFVPVNNSGPKPVQIGTDIPFWVSTLAEFNVERENEEPSQDQGENQDVSCFEKFMEKFVTLLKKGNPKLLDCIGSFFVSFIRTGFEKKDFKLVLGLTSFVCEKMFDNNLEKFELTSGSMQELLEALAGFCEEGNEMLENVTEMLRSVLVDV
ncbi:hypothetical protein LUZ60_010356 [Juncus effusus]|nr:hypothetical protein LUZ60_010356 [Juncus effusus]